MPVTPQIEPKIVAVGLAVANPRRRQSICRVCNKRRAPR
jgi:hypothetical protein